jgi:ATP-dependent helicase HepA
VPHQIEVARRILEDPLQRYLLADEVGMGKTIEAGLVIRQFLLSQPEGEVWAIVPCTILSQWKRELERKFSIGDFPGRVRMFPSDCAAFPDHSMLRLLVVDEAHHLIANRIPKWLPAFAKHAERLLLLTATPSLARSDVLLRLLRLLDPDAYASVTEEAFTQRVAEREDLGIFLRGLRSDASSVLLRQRVRQLPERFPNDPTLLQLGAAIAEGLGANDQARLRSAIVGLRSHIADVYRIHQRLIRTRRSDAAVWVFRSRGTAVDATGEGDLGHVLQTWTEEPGADDLFDLFEQWRQELTTRYPRGARERSTVQGLVVRLFEAFGCGLTAFLQELACAADEFVGPEWRSAFADAYPRDPGEGAKERATQVAQAVAKSAQRLASRSPKRLPRIVLFGSNADDLSRCVSALRTALGHQAVLVAADFDVERDDVAAAFSTHGEAKVLVCSPREEEGLNLHFADLLVHLDLPFDPARIEQRIGRLDRFGRIQDRVDQRVVLPELTDDGLSPWDAWMDVLADGFHIFNAPVADVQFLLGELDAILADALLEGGATGLRAAIPVVRQRLFDERLRLDDQYALDRVIQEEEAANSFCDAIEVAEGDEEQLGRDAKAWFVGCLHFDLKGDLNRTFQVRWEQGYTLLPARPWAEVFGPGVVGRHTFSRRLALTDPEPVQLLRVGSLLYRAAERHLAWEDRGTAFATWRWIPDHEQQEWVAFKLCYVVQGRLAVEVTAAELQALRARLDGYLPPWLEVIYIDPALTLVTDPERLALLEQPYRAATNRGKDFNLSSRLQALYQVIDAAQFHDVCHAARDHAESWLRAQKHFQRAVSDAVERGRADLERRIHRLKLRTQAQLTEGQTESGLRREIELSELMLVALQEPEVHLDSIGAIVVSGRQPVGASDLEA